MSVHQPRPATAHSSTRAYPRVAQTTLTPSGSISPGWYTDPRQPGQRWWDGTQWTAHAVQAAPPATTHKNITTVSNSTTVVAIGHHKSAGAALVLTFLFGPLGMLYSTVLGAFTMIFVMITGSVIIGTVTLGVGDLFWFPLCWIICIIWGCAATSGSGTQVVATQATHQNS